MSLLAGSFTTLSAGAISEGESETKVEKKSDKKPSFIVTDKEIKFPGVTVNRATKEVRIDAEVCLQNGILEYVVVSPDTFEHESIFTTKATPEFVHAALLLCGLKESPLGRMHSGPWAESAMKKKQSRVKIEVEWKEGKVNKRVNLTSMIMEREDDDYDSALHQKNDGPKTPKKGSLVQDAWIFSGSYIYHNKRTKKQIYAANSSGVLIGVWPNPSTVIQYGIMSGNPYEANHLGLEINDKFAPKTGTKVKLVFSLHDLKEIEKDKKKALKLKNETLRNKIKKSK